MNNGPREKRELWIKIYYGEKQKKAALSEKFHQTVQTWRSDLEWYRNEQRQRQDFASYLQIRSSNFQVKHSRLIIYQNLLSIRDVFLEFCDRCKFPIHDGQHEHATRVRSVSHIYKS